MIGISSRSAGVLLLPKPGTYEYAVLDVIGGGEQDPVEAQYLYSAVQDWEEVAGTDTDDLLKTATSEYWLARTVSLLRLAIGGLERPLEKRVLEHVEDILGSRVPPEKALDRLLVAPLKDPSSPSALANAALSYGFSVVASILDELKELQPLLHKLTDIWLGLAETAFSDFLESREMIWATVVEKGGMKRLLKAGSIHDFITKWNLLVFHFPTQQSRFGVSILGQELSRHLFPSKEREEIMAAPLTEEAEPTPIYQPERVMNVYQVFEKVKKQINAVTDAVSQGHDAKAEKFLRELVQEQISYSGGESHAVKSLCNIAQRCADMFRMDFEVLCLNKAHRIDPFDIWTLIQLGNHMKRVGNYDEALRIFGQAEQWEESDVVKMSEADVYSQKGAYAQAISICKTIPNWNDKPEVSTAIADNLRRMGRMDESETAYRELIQLAQQGLAKYIDCEIRAQTGIAEIAKRQGKLEDALQIYYEILERESISDRDRCFYRLGLCNVLKLMGKFDEAYEVVDEVIQQYPFAMEARFIRGSILGLIGQELEGLKDLPESSGSRSWREWLRHYYRGLLLLKLKRSGDAKKNLVEELSKAIASEEDKAILRMAAALYFLSQDETSEADGILSRIPDLDNCYSQYLSFVLQMHSAARREDLATIDSLKKRIAEFQFVDDELEKAVVALSERNFSLALNYEANALLKLAA